MTYTLPSLADATHLETLLEGHGSLSAGVDRELPRGALVRVIAGPDLGRELHLGLEPMIVGASSQCNLTLRDARVSRRHLELRLEPAGVRVRDLGSTNGVTVRGAQVKEALVPMDAVIELGKTQLQISSAARPRLPPSGREAFGGLVGDGPLMREIFAILELVSPTDSTVLIQGESGTGKELVARALHDHSSRANGPFVVVDCGAAKDQLIESSFFGHRRGAFTGAVEERKGAFVKADRGTVFLDEIGELPLASQAKLLRVLESRTVQPLGSDERVSIDTRVVAATHRDLPRMVEEGTFRFDLYHRLSVVHVALPALRDRLDDLPPLIRRFFAERGVEPGPIEGENLDRLRSQAWPGNVRELKNAVERGFVFSGLASPTFAELKLFLGPGVEPPQSGPRVDTSLPFREAKDAWVAIFEREYVTALHREHGGNITKAARAADMDRGHFRRILQKHGLDGSSA